MKAIRKRARGEEQKALRRAQILAAAEARFHATGYERISLSEIAADVGLTKAALYRYFRSKEALFIGLFDRAFARLLEGARTVDARDPAGAIAETLLGNPLYCRLSAIMNSVLEACLDEDEARSFKRSLLGGMRRLAAILEERAILSPGSAIDQIFQVQQALIGCWHMSQRSPIMERIVREPEFRLFAIEFETALRAHIGRLIPPGPNS